MSSDPVKFGLGSMCKSDSDWKMDKAATVLKSRKKKRKSTTNSDADDHLPTFSQAETTDPSTESRSNGVDEESRKENLEHLFKMLLFTEDIARAHFSAFFTNEVATGNIDNPFIAKPLSESSMKKHLKRYVKYFFMVFIKETQKEKANNIEELPNNVLASYEVIQKLNKQLIESLQSVGGFSSEQMKCTRAHCTKFVVAKPHANRILSTIKDDMEVCLVPQCSKTAHRWILLETPSSEEDTSEAPVVEHRKVLSLCSAHFPIYEVMFSLIHMDWNMYRNCQHRVSIARESSSDTVKWDLEEILDAIPAQAKNSLILNYMGIYNLLWVFGDVKDWQKRGFQLFKHFSKDI